VNAEVWTFVLLFGIPSTLMLAVWIGFFQAFSTEGRRLPAWLALLLASACAWQGALPPMHLEGFAGPALGVLLAVPGVVLAVSGFIAAVIWLEHSRTWLGRLTMTAAIWAGLGWVLVSSSV
jgi:hypothetical protein